MLKNFKEQNKGKYSQHLLDKLSIKDIFKDNNRNNAYPYYEQTYDITNSYFKPNNIPQPPSLHHNQLYYPKETNQFISTQNYRFYPPTSNPSVQYGNYPHHHVSLILQTNNTQNNNNNGVMNDNNQFTLKNEDTSINPTVFTSNPIQDTTQQSKVPLVQNTNTPFNPGAVYGQNQNLNLKNNNTMVNNGNNSTISNVNVINNEYKRQSYFNTHPSTMNMQLFKASTGKPVSYNSLSAKNDHLSNQLTGNKRIRYVKNNKLVYVQKGSSVAKKLEAEAAMKEEDVCSSDKNEIMFEQGNDVTLQDDDISKGKKPRGSKFRGVSRNGNQWQVLIMVNKKKRYVGSYSNEEEAARAYDKVALQNHGTKAKTNFDYLEEELNKIMAEPPLLKVLM